MIGPQSLAIWQTRLDSSAVVVLAAVKGAAQPPPAMACGHSFLTAAARRPASTDRGTEYCGSPERHEYELYLAVEDIDHTRTKTRSPQTNGICERFHRTVLDEFYRVAFRKKIYRTIEELQTDLDAWVVEYNQQRPHQGRWCYGKTPIQTLIDALPLAKEKLMAA